MLELSCILHPITLLRVKVFHVTNGSNRISIQTVAPLSPVLCCPVDTQAMGSQQDLVATEKYIISSQDQTTQKNRQTDRPTD